MERENEMMMIMIGLLGRAASEGGVVACAMVAELKSVRKEGDRHDNGC